MNIGHCCYQSQINVAIKPHTNIPSEIPLFIHKLSAVSYFTIGMIIIIIIIY